MRIDRVFQGKRRKGVLSMEMVMLLPFMVIAMLSARFIAESMIARNAASVSVRSTAHAAASGSLCLGFNRDSSREDYRRSWFITCSGVDDEQGLRGKPRYFESLERITREYRGMLRQVTPEGRLDGKRASLTGETRHTSARFSGALVSAPLREDYRAPYHPLWSHFDEPWKAAYDPVIYKDLQRRGTHRLFPNVFPAANGN